MPYVIRSVGGMGVIQIGDGRSWVPSDYSPTLLDTPVYSSPKFQCPTGDLVTSPQDCPGGAPAGTYSGQMSTTDQLQYEIDALWNKLLGPSDTPTTPTTGAQGMSTGELLAIGGGIFAGLLILSKAMR